MRALNDRLREISAIDRQKETNVIMPAKSTSLDFKVLSNPLTGVQHTAFDIVYEADDFNCGLYLSVLLVSAPPHLFDNWSKLFLIL